MIDPLFEGLADPDPEKRRKAIFGVLSHRRHDLLPALYEFALSEKEGDLAVLATQVVLSLRAAPPDRDQETLIEQAISETDGFVRLEAPSWEYLAVAGNQRHRLQLLAMLSKSASSPHQARGFIESCMGHCDPDVRTAACRPAVATGCGRLLAWVLAAIEDPDAGVGREAFAAVETASRPVLGTALGEALADPDEWIPNCVAAFLPVIADEDMREAIMRGSESPLPRIASRSREVLGRLDARKLSSQQLHPPPVPPTAPLPRVKESGGAIPVASPPGPLPWAHLVAPPEAAPVSTVSPGRTVGKDRVISMRGKIGAGDRPGLTEPAAFPAADSAEAKHGKKTSKVNSAAVKLAEDLFTPAMPPGDIEVATISEHMETAPPVGSDIWEAVSVDFSSSREPRLSVNLDSITPVEPQNEPEMPEQSRNGVMTLEKPQIIDTILERYPSFITSPLSRFFTPAGTDSLMETLRSMTEPLIAFLSFTFLQTYLFFGSRTPKGDQAAKDALKAHFVGPTAVRTLHHLSLSVIEVEGDSFFTIGLARAMSEVPEDENPLFMLRKVAELLQTPLNVASDEIRQVAKMLPALLTPCREILRNPIVLKLPPGAREPYLNLSGPRACPLAAADRPSFDLPSNEIVLLSKDRSEALGLFPYFTFNGQEVIFRIPSDAEFKTLLERLGLTL